MNIKDLKKTIEIGDYVITKKRINDIDSQSVGLIKKRINTDFSVLFIGKNKIIKVNDKNLDYLDINETDKPYNKKICNVCHILKDRLKDFSINQTDAKGRKTTRPTCKICRVTIDGAPLNIAENKRLDSIKPVGIFCCPICQKTSIVNITANLVKDHDHNTGKGREWICDSCNTGLGRFKDNVELLQRAIDYLKRYS